MNTQIEDRCSTCGEKNRSGAHFCAHCGHPLADVLATEAQAEVELPLALADGQTLGSEENRIEIDEAGITGETAVDPLAPQANTLSQNSSPTLPTGLYLVGRYQIIEHLVVTDAPSFTYLANDWGSPHGHDHATPPCPFPPDYRIHADRTARGDRHHCDPGQHAPAGAGQGQEQGQADRLHEQHAPAGHRHRDDHARRLEAGPVIRWQH